VGVHVKFCGLTRPEDVEAAVAAGADYVGLVLTPSARRVSVEDAASLALVARSAGFEGGLVGVFIDPSFQELERAALACDLDVLQLHGRESPRDVVQATRLRPVWKTVSVTAEMDADAVAAEAARYEEAEAILLDTGGLPLRGGTGVPFDPASARRVVSERHVLVAGGLTVESVGEVVRALDPFGVDVSSGVESAPGVKDAAKLEAFMAAVRRAEPSA